MSAPALAPYDALVAYAERELELAGRGELARLQELADGFEAIVAMLPSIPPPEAAELIMRAQLMHERTRIELLRTREVLLAELATLRRARAAAGGYGRQGAPRAAVEHCA